MCYCHCHHCEQHCRIILIHSSLWCRCTGHIWKNCCSTSIQIITALCWNFSFEVCLPVCSCYSLDLSATVLLVYINEWNEKNEFATALILVSSVMSRPLCCESYLMIFVLFLPVYLLLFCLQFYMVSVAVDVCRLCSRQNWCWALAGFSWVCCEWRH